MDAHRRAKSMAKTIVLCELKRGLTETLEQRPVVGSATAIRPQLARTPLTYTGSGRGMDGDPGADALGMRRATPYPGGRSQRTSIV